MLNLKSSPWSKKTGELKKAARQIVEFTGRDVLWLFDPDLYEQDFLPRATLVAEIEPRLLLPESEALSVAALNPAPDDALIAEERDNVADFLHRTLGTLTMREEDTIRRRFGFEPYDRPQRDEEIADAFDVSRERVRQIEGKGLRKMRHPFRGVPLKRVLRGEQPFEHGGREFPKPSLADLMGPYAALGELRREGTRRYAAELQHEDLETIARRSNALVAELGDRHHVTAAELGESDDAWDENEAAWEDAPSCAPAATYEVELLPTVTVEPLRVDEGDFDWPTARARIIEADEKRRLQRQEDAERARIDAAWERLNRGD